jgi:hypothetical protein
MGESLLEFDTSSVRQGGRKWRATTRGVSDVWQTKDLQTAIFGSVASKGLMGGFSDLFEKYRAADEHLIERYYKMKCKSRKF